MRRSAPWPLSPASHAPRAFQLALTDLGAQPGQVLFIDDRPGNTCTARDLGMHTITFTSASALDRELRLTTLGESAGAPPGCPACKSAARRGRLEETEQ